MFTTLLGGLPRPPIASGDPEDIDALVARVVEAQAAAGLELLTDGRLRWPGFSGPLAGLDGIEDRAGQPAALRPPVWTKPLSLAAWRFAAGVTDRPVKQALPGPYSLARRLAVAGGPDRDALAAALAAAVRREIEALAAAGCPVVEIEEPDAVAIGEDPVERRRFRDAQLAAIEGLGGVHLSLAITGGSADAAGIDTILAAPYASLAVDLIDGPNNWRLARDVPGERGVVVGALSHHHPSDDGPEQLLWAVAYAASMHGRGRDRVGLATAGGLADLPWEIAERKLGRLGEAARIAALPPAEAVTRLDPRAVDIRTAALGHGARRPRDPRRR